MMLSRVAGKTLMGSKCLGPASLGAGVSRMDLDGWCHYWHANTKVTGECGNFSPTINTPRWTSFSNQIFIAKLLRPLQIHEEAGAQVMEIC